MEGIITAWGKNLRGYRPSLSIEITRDCPLRCPGCYAYGDDHLGGSVTLRQVSDYKGQELIDRILALVDDVNPFDVSIVGGEPLVRFRELNEILPQARRARHLDAARHERRAAEPGRVGVDSAPADRRLNRRSAARTRRAAHAGHLRPHPQAHRRTADHRALHRDSAAGAARRLHGGVRQVLVGQSGCPPDLVQPLHAAGRRGRAGDSDAGRSRARHRGPDVAAAGAIPKIAMPEGAAAAIPPHRRTSPDDCVFAQTTTCVSADFAHRITPCQFGGNPDCSQCGCMASAGTGRGRRRIGCPGGSPGRRGFHDLPQTRADHRAERTPAPPMDARARRQP